MEAKTPRRVLRRWVEKTAPALKELATPASATSKTASSLTTTAPASRVSPATTAISMHVLTAPREDLDALIPRTPTGAVAIRQTIS